MRILRMFFAFFMLIGGIVVAALPVQAADIAGQVTRIKNAATAVRGGEIQQLGVGTVVYIGDTIKTGPDARIEMRMLDEATITLGENAEFAIEDYLFDRERGVGKVLLRIAVGTFRAVTGGINELRDSTFALNSPVATIGIRGTDFWGGPLDGVYNVALLDGAAIYVENAAGRVEITQPGFGTTVAGPDVAPTPPVQWAAEKVSRAVETVSF